MNRSKILKKIDRLSSFYEKLEYLNTLFLKAKNKEDEDLILKMIEELKFYCK